MKVYAPMWFNIKTQSSIKYGSVHLWKTISESRGLPKGVKTIIDKVISTNAYFAHPENILIAMIANERSHIRELGIRRILKTKKQPAAKKLRIFKIPPLNWNAKDYTEMIDWSECCITEPPLTIDIKSEDLLAAIENKSFINFSKLPSHTQAVERCVKIITEASSKVCGHSSRDGFIRVKIEARKNLPMFDNKKQYYNVEK
ncbi:unnamed protein product [Brassicogethes aeneus]|uniref:Uncharacterized protein n=1 Tax=Brassicogethes aeneus TaxID=1431903 RepID=A0A9P0B4M8_BRAAE|nr:unnamed protein product [Brassicogethes aeneus]